ncbi:GGL domain-containing protein [Hypoxylon crocopeplum]|nr:GGL domain-containing protein [Hypoxylon crocopeplum]
MSSIEIHDPQILGGAASGLSTQPLPLGHLARNESTTSSTTPTVKMPQYTSRDVGDPSQIKKNKQSMADLKLRRLTELNSRLREDLERERIPVSQAARSIIAYCNSTRDYMVPSVWGAVPRSEDPYAPQQNGGCCLVM